MKDFRCFHCGALLMRGLLVVAQVEIKCPKCNARNEWSLGDVAGCPMPAFDR
jgi:phage FluMu protein Com